ncbi:ankyrin repeat domain-containing protein [Candidatus Dependentiae bacterium]|nr:ankyrin repeat domain-containing protein [Candidatus Dependentiae bacterium]
MNNKINFLLFFFLSSLSAGSSMYAMQNDKDVLSEFFDKCPKELPTLLLKEIGSVEPPHEAFKNLCSLARTSSFFNSFLQNQTLSINLVKHIYSIYPNCRGDELLPLLFFINTDVARYYYAKEFIENSCPHEIQNKIHYTYNQFPNSQLSFKNFYLGDKLRAIIDKGVNYLKKITNNNDAFESIEFPMPIDQLLKAIQNKKLTEIRLLSHLGVSFNAQKECKEDNYHYLTNPLESAILTHDPVVMKLCIDLGKLATNIDCFFDALRMRCHRQIRFSPESQLELIKAFVDLGADVNSRNRRRRTPLHIATQANNVEIVEFLLSEGASPHSYDILGSTPLEEAYLSLDESRMPSFVFFALRLFARVWYVGKYICSSEINDLQTFIIVEHLAPLSYLAEELISFLGQKLKNSILNSSDNHNDSNQNASNYDENRQSNIIMKILSYKNPAHTKNAMAARNIINQLEKKETISTLDSNQSIPRNNENITLLRFHSAYILKCAVMLYVFAHIYSFVFQGV